MSEEEYISIEPIEERIKNYMDDIDFVVHSPESYESIRVPASSNVNYRHIYVSVS